MGSSTVDSSKIKFLPTEIVYQILSAVKNDDYHEVKNIVEAFERKQSTLHACCLVSRQWYTEAIPMLYEEPFIEGSRFQKFAATVCPPLGTRESKYKLASLVRKLHMGGLVHQSSNSVTARLVGRVRQNLEEFTAPMYSFSEMSLLALSKCSNLRRLDLSLVISRIEPVPLRKTISRLQNLRFLRVPDGELLEYPVGKDSVWPPLLEELEFSGYFPITSATITWPENLTTLRLFRCTEIHRNPFLRLLHSLESCSKLRRLTITEPAKDFDDHPICHIPKILPNLTFLSVPGASITENFFFLLYEIPLKIPYSDVLPLRTLELGYSSEGRPRFELDSFLDALQGVFSNIRQIGFHEAWCDEQRIIDDEKLENVIIANAEARAKAATAQEGNPEQSKKKKKKRDLNPGVYYFDD